MKKEEKTLPETWTCAKCGEALVESQVQVHYLGNAFSMKMLRCPRCGASMVTEEMAIGKMAEAEKILEDK
jgi:transcription elongation factor Elf1